MRAFVFVLALIWAAAAWSIESYWVETRGDRITRAFVSGEWHIRCTGYKSGDAGRSCTLESKSRGKNPIGTYKTSDQGPLIYIHREILGRRHFNIKPGWKVIVGGNFEIDVGGETFSVQHRQRSGKPKFEGSDAANIVSAFKAENYATFRYQGTTGQKFDQRISLAGFTKAWKIATDYVGFDPLNSGR